MFEIQGWISVTGWKEGVRDGDSLILQEASRINFSPLHTDMFSWNGTHTFMISGTTNRNRGYVSGIEELVDYIFSLAKISYGIIYHSDENEENFKVKVVRQNIIEEREDPFLSPYFPMIEDVSKNDEDI
jgi:Immunity protein 7